MVNLWPDRCPVCTNIFDLPMVFKCGHSICKTCHDSWYTQYQPRRAKRLTDVMYNVDLPKFRCPLCEGLQDDRATVNYALKDLLVHFADMKKKLVAAEKTAHLKSQTEKKLRQQLKDASRFNKTKCETVSMLVDANALLQSKLKNQRKESKKLKYELSSASTELDQWSIIVQSMEVLHLRGQSEVNDPNDGATYPIVHPMPLDVTAEEFFDWAKESQFFSDMFNGAKNRVKEYVKGDRQIDTRTAEMVDDIVSVVEQRPSDYICNCRHPGNPAHQRLLKRYCAKCTQ